MKIEIDVPDGKSGEWEIKTMTAQEPSPTEKARAVFSEYGRIVPPGTYKGLFRNNSIIMSNTPDEIRDSRYFINIAKGDVLINGLGLGVVLKAILDKPQINSVTVIESSQDVINLVAPTYKNDKRVTIIHDDAFTYTPPKGKRYNAVWHDIWDGITSDNLPEMTKLHRKYARKTDYQDSWCKSMCQRIKKHGY
jgi:16S rRNA A1518/A1519 N6-dimethyltransferase RsmA/KsgA/DIM1 with predicted DNA glycosylase/AP lyase activity